MHNNKQILNYNFHYMIHSDIDLVVSFPPSQQIRLRRLAQCLELQEICRDAQIIEGATVSRTNISFAHNKKQN